MSQVTATRIDGELEQKISRVVGGINNLPTPPIVYTQIQKVLSNPNTSAYDIASILQEDPAMSAKVLKLTNSAYYGLAREVESVKQAVVIVGIEAIKNLVLSASIIGMFSKEQIDSDFQDYFWRHSLATAFGARLIAMTLKKNIIFDPEGGFSAGLLHDIGKMVISVYMPKEREAIKKKKAQNPKTPDYRIEEEALGFNHAQIGTLLATKWKLPAKLIEAIEFHHDPQQSDISSNSLPLLIHLANYLASYTFEYNPEDDDPYIAPLADGVIAFTGATDDDFQEMSPSLRIEYAKSETFLEMAKGSQN